MGNVIYMPPQHLKHQAETETMYVQIGRNGYNLTTDEAVREIGKFLTENLDPISLKQLADILKKRLHAFEKVSETQEEPTEEEKAKFRRILQERFDWLGNDDPAEGADAVDGICEMFQDMGGVIGEDSGEETEEGGGKE